MVCPCVCSQKDQDNTFFDGRNPAITNCRMDTYNGRSINRLDGAPFTKPPPIPSDPPIAGRLCTKGEIAIWLNASSKPEPTVPMILSSDNCQPLSGKSLDGCKPGFASWTKSSDVLLKSTDPVVRQDLTGFETGKPTPTPATYHAMACCAGYFCPENLACMIRERPNDVLLTSHFPTSYCIKQIFLLSVEEFQGFCWSDKKPHLVSSAAAGPRTFGVRLVCLSAGNMTTVCSEVQLLTELSTSSSCSLRFPPFLIVGALLLPA